MIYRKQNNITYIATLLHQVLVVDVGLDDEVLSVLGLDDDGDLGDLNDLDKFSAKHIKLNKSDDNWN